MKIAILSNDIIDSEKSWIDACEDKGLEYQVIDLSSSEWLKKINEGNFKLLLTCPTGIDPVFKKMYDERIFILSEVMKIPCYPSYKEISIHENKVFLSYWLVANKIPHPETFIFYELKEAMIFCNNTSFPVVVKTNIGASGSGVNIIASKLLLKAYLKKAFSKEGILPKAGPNLQMGDTRKRLLYALKNPSHIKKRLGIYQKIKKHPQKGFVFIQEFIPHEFEWRVVRIGDSYFAHKKIKSGEKASGTKGIDFVKPPEKLLSFVKEICEMHNFNSMAVDIFEYDNKYLVNEMQTIFGHVQDYITEVDGSPGRYIFDNGWVFEKGLFNSNISYDLRLKNAIKLQRI